MLFSIIILLFSKFWFLNNTYTQENGRNEQAWERDYVAVKMNFSIN